MKARKITGLISAVVTAVLMMAVIVQAGEIKDTITFDFHTEKQEAYLNDPDPGNIAEYANGLKDFSQPEALVCDFSEDEGIGENDTYVFQKASDPDFTDAVTITDLGKKSYDLFNLKLGERFFWRGGTSLEDIENSPIHEVAVQDHAPRVCRIEGVTNVRDIGGYESSLAEGGRLRQGLYYRGAKLNGIKRKGAPRVTEELGVKVEIDLRDPDQCNGPYVKGTEYYAVPISGSDKDSRFEEFAEEYARIYELVSHAQEAPVYLHCLAGADRTGLVTFMLLAVCGVSYDDIARDYLFTNFSDQGKRDLEELNSWRDKLEALDGETTADKAASWMMSKGVPAEQIERIRTIFVEGYGE